MPSAAHWACEWPALPSQAASLLQRAIRIPDPSVQVYDRWLVRRLGPNVGKIDAGKWPAFIRTNGGRDTLQAMGWETANIHLGTKSASELLALVDGVAKTCGPQWLETASAAMLAALQTDFAVWKKAHGS
jgi:hypothetical protein